MRSDIAELVTDAKERDLLFNQSILQNLKPKIEPKFIQKQNQPKNRGNQISPKPKSTNVNLSNSKTQLAAIMLLVHVTGGKIANLLMGRKN
ncbi:MAG: hypothetical protein H0V82_13085 [Candidatus Protochlamydia sp.]|nr:hypothetical protein [Candidatus Protochlamydia sp.]